VLGGERQLGRRVAIIGAGGIGFDIAGYLLQEGQGPPEVGRFMAEWGVDMAYTGDGGLQQPVLDSPLRQITLLQRKSSRPGAGLGRTTGWIHRAVLKRNRVEMLGGVEYLGLDSAGLRIRREGREQTLVVDEVVLCAGQLSDTGLAVELDARGISYQVIGGARKAAEVDAQRAIREGIEVADRL
jgi:2,4-dienoyl-CoA reductase (NADPH2)